MIPVPYRYVRHMCAAAAAPPAVCRIHMLYTCAHTVAVLSSFLKPMMHVHVDCRTAVGGMWLHWEHAWV